MAVTIGTSMWPALIVLALGLVACSQGADELTASEQAQAGSVAVPATEDVQDVSTALPELVTVESGHRKGWKRIGADGPVIHPDLADEDAIAVYQLATEDLERRHPISVIEPDGDRIKVRTWDPRPDFRGGELLFYGRSAEGWQPDGRGLYAY